jgi:Zn finger protein HypA/HybF involved in hydrogenase expression
MTPLHVSLMADQLRCQSCGEQHSTDSWPLHGDHVPFYFQDEPGNYSLKVTCPHCHSDWYVVWDDDPGQVLPLGFS